MEPGTRTDATRRPRLAPLVAAGSDARQRRWIARALDTEAEALAFVEPLGAAGSVWEFVRRLLELRASLPPGARVAWIEPRCETWQLEREEAEQLLGLIAHVQLTQESALPDGTACWITAGPLRREVLGTALRWPRFLLDRRGPIPRLSRLLRSLPPLLRDGIHLFALPASTRLSGSWKRAVSWLAREVAIGDALFGVVVPVESLRREQPAAAVAHLRRSLALYGAADRVCCLAVEDACLPDDSTRIAEFAARLGLCVDLSLRPASRLPGQAPYLGMEPYWALDCDLRAPRFLRGAAELLELPALGGSELLTSLAADRGERQQAALADAIFDADLRARIERLLQALDRRKRSAYLEDLARQPRRVAHWAQHHVYNWAPTLPDRLVVLDFGVESLLGQAPDSPRSLLAEAARAQTTAGGRLGSPFVGARRGVELARRAASTRLFPSLHALRSAQRSAHDYLFSGDRKLTADRAQLIERLPESLGSTLEIGSGQGITAELVRDRATRYVAVDLDARAGRAMIGRGGSPAVADQHELPFRDASFDSVIADNVLEHAHDPREALREVRRVLRGKGRLYALLPLDASSSRYQIRTHLWKADAGALQRVAREACLHVALLQVFDYFELGVYGCFPASGGQTCLAILEAA